MYIKVRTSESAKAYSKCERRVKELGFTNEEDKKNQAQKLLYSKFYKDEYIQKKQRVLKQ